MRGDVGQFRAGCGPADHGAAAGQHAGQLGRHDEISRAGALRQQVDVRRVQQRAQPGRRLQIQEPDARQAVTARLQRRAFRPLAAEYEPDPRVVGKLTGYVGQRLQPLLATHVA
ncbi:hypothetical protein G6F68_017176 [Rhizopus microsporus]|nr:hypothetical protein G6F68_017176 [Rhizopus microsporus]